MLDAVIGVKSHPALFVPQHSTQKDPAPDCHLQHYTAASNEAAFHSYIFLLQLE